MQVIICESVHDMFNNRYSLCAWIHIINSQNEVELQRWTTTHHDYLLICFCLANVRLSGARVISIQLMISNEIDVVIFKYSMVQA